MKKLSIFLTLVAGLFCANSAIFGQVIISNTTPVTQNFDTIGSTATATLPGGWKTDSGTATTVYANAAGATTAAAGTSGAGVLGSGSSGASYNFANGVTASSTDRAVGWLSSGSFSSPRQLFVQLTNNSGQTLTSLNVAFDIEKYRTGTRAFTINFFSSTDGTNWTAQTLGDQAYAADAANAVVNPPTTINKTLTLSNLSIANGSSIYLRWSYTGTGGNTNAQGLGIDNFSATPTFAPAANVDLTVSRTVSDAAGQGDIISYELYVDNGGTSNASNVKMVFTAPSQFNVTNAFTNCDFTVSRAGNVVTYTGGNVNAGASCNLTVRATSPTAGIKVTSNIGDAVVDPDNTIAETDESNNATTDAAQTKIFFPNTVTGLYGRSSLAQLFADIADIGGGYTVNINQNLVENTDLNIPSGRLIDLGSFVISGTANIHFGGGFYDGFRTSHPNGIGDATHPGNFQTTGTVTFTDAVDAEYYAVALPPLSELGTPSQTAYGNPAQIQSFTINNPNGVTFLAPFSVDRSFNLTNGIVNNGSNTITLGLTSQINGENDGEGSETSFIAGKMTKYVAGFGGGEDRGISFNFVFPVGTIGGPQQGYSPLRVSNYFASDFGAGLTVQAFDTNSPGVSTPSISRYWQIDEIGNMVTDMQFFWRSGDDSAITVAADATIIRNNQVACSGNCTIDMPNRNASITGVSDFSPWSVAQRVTTAAGAGISGRVLNSLGTGEYRAKVYATDQNGQTQTISTNSFGYYHFEGLRAGETYTLNVKVKQAQYAPRIVSVNEDVLNFDFIPQE